MTDLVGLRTVSRRSLLSAVVTATAAIATASFAEDAPPPETSPVPKGDMVVPAGVRVKTMLIEDDVSGAKGFDVDDDGVPMVAIGSDVRVLGSDRVAFSFSPHRIEDFAWMAERRFVAVTDEGRLVSPSANGIAVGLRMPAPGMKLRAAANDRLFVFGGRDPEVARSLFLVTREGKIAKLLTMPEPITDVAGDMSMTWVAAGRTLLKFGQSLPVSVQMETAEPMVSVVDTGWGGVFYATAGEVGHLRRFEGSMLFLRSVGGKLVLRSDRLFIWNADRQLLVAIEPVQNFR